MLNCEFRTWSRLRPRVEVLLVLASRKGSSCSTPVSCCRSQIDYPSPNFVRTSMSGMGFGKGVSVDDNAKLTIRLHYNPVMDEWVRYDSRDLYYKTFLGTNMSISHCVDFFQCTSQESNEVKN